MRAIAVMAVILAHLSISWLPGGFVGVDIFFVISGYLITGLLLREYDAKGDISLSDFYRRRIRRLFPAMLVTCLFTVLGGFLIFSQERFELLLDSTLAAFFSVSNFYFWSQVGYFDTESSVKPLLHTWSLGVEEQFYLVWPLLILCMLRYYGRRSVITALIVSSILSFGLNALFMSYDVGDRLADATGWRSGFLDGNSTAFYLMPFRIFEFGLGALLVFMRPRLLMVRPIAADVIILGALAGLCFLMTSLTEHSVFPYYNALWVALLSALIIAFAGKSRVAGLLLANPVMVFIGGISYSLYLVHWPLIVYYKALFGELDSVAVGALLVAMFVLGYALNIMVENRFRQVPARDSASGVAALVSRGAIFLALTVSVVTVLLLKNVDGRVPEHRVALSNAEWRKLERQQYCSDSLKGFPKHIFTCQNDRGSKHTVVVWGDSHALHLVAGISEAFPESNIAVAYLSGCISQSGFKGLVRKFPSQKLTDECVERNKAFLRWAKNYKGDVVVYISNAKRNKPEQVSVINNLHVARLEQYGHVAYVIGDFIRPGVELAQCYSVPNFLLTDSMLRARCKFDAQAVKAELRYSEKLATLSKNYIPVHAIQCSKGECKFSDDAGRISFRDTHHLSPLGAIYWVNKLKEAGAFQAGWALANSAANL